MPESNIVSVAVAVGDDQSLAKIDRNLPLESIVDELCEAYQLPGESRRYALQIARPSPRAGDSSLANRYVTSKLIDQVLDGTELRLVFSPRTTIELLLKAVERDSSSQKKSALAKLASACEDPEFARCFVETRGHNLVVDKLRTADAVEATAALACLRLSMQHGHLKWMSLLCVDRVVAEIVGPGENNTLREALLTGCLILANSADKSHGAHLRKALSAPETLNLIVSRSSGVQLAVLGMVNALLLSADDESRDKDLKMLSSAERRRLIFRHVLGSGQKSVDRDVAHQLHVLQTLLLNFIIARNNETSASDLEDVKTTKLPWRSTNTETLLDGCNDVSTEHARFSASRITLDGYNSNYMPATPFSPRSSPALGKYRSHISTTSRAPVSQLAIHCLEYFSTRYHDSFSLAKEEAELASGISSIAEDVVKVLCEILHIGTCHSQPSEWYDPILFAARDPFFDELFCHAIWTLGRTRRDLRARERVDHEVVIRVLRRQLEDALATRPTTLNALAESLRDVTAAKVQEAWVMERERKFELILQGHPAVLKLRKKMRPEAANVVTQQRLNAIKAGQAFSKQLDTLKSQKAKNWWFAHVSEDERVIIYGEWNPEVRIYANLQKRINIATATGLVTGKRCPHAKGRKFMDNGLFFSLLHESGSLDFIAPNKEVYNLWTDGLNHLLGRPVESTAFNKDVQTIVDMEIRLKLLELGDEGVATPFDAPPAPPPPPENYDFTDKTYA